MVPGFKTGPVLIVTVGTRACAIPLEHVSESMRPLPVESVAGAPEFIRGVSMIRGAPIPVVDLKALLENRRASDTYHRLVTLKLPSERRLAVGVDAVVGVRNLDESALYELPSMLRDTSADLVEAIGARDAQLLVLLRATRIVSDDVWASLEKPP